MKHILSRLRLPAIQLVTFMLCLIWSASSSSGIAQEEPVELAKTRKYVVPMLPFDRLALPYPVVRVRINGSEPMPFLVDTGLDIGLVLDHDFAEKLRLPLRPGKQKPEQKLTSRILNRVEIMTATPEAPFQLPVHLALAREIDTAGWGKEPIVGLIGIAALYRYTLRFDFSKSVMCIYDGQHPRIRLSNVHTLNLTQPNLPIGATPEQGDGRFVVSFYLGAMGQQARTLVNCFLDTGSPITMLPGDTIPLIQYPVVGEGKQGITLREGTEFVRRSYTVLLYQTFDFGYGAEPMTTISFHNGQVPPLIGIDPLSRYDLILDFPNKQMHLLKPADYQKRIRRYAELPMRFRTEEGRYYIEELPHDSIAALSGAQVNDRIVSVDGQALDGWGYRSVALMVAGYAETKAVLELERKTGAGTTRRLTVTYKRPSMFTPAAPNKSVPSTGGQR